MDAAFTSPLTVHIVSGGVTLLAAAVAITSKLVDAPHRPHVLAGRAFF